MTKYDELYELCRKFYEGKVSEYDNYNLSLCTIHYESQVVTRLDDINCLLKYIWQNNFNELQLTPTGAIKKHEISNIVGGYNLCERYTKNNVFKGIQLTILVKNTIFRFVFGYRSNEADITGNTGFKEFAKACKKHGIELKKFAVDNGLEIKAKIESPIIRNYRLGEKLSNVHHLDFNQAWPSEVCKVYPEFTPVFAELRNKNKYYADSALGFMQSQYCDYKYADLSRIGINGCNQSIKDMMVKLIETKHKIIGINTDGIWYQGDIYHDENEGKALGQWKNDHINCEFYAYSDGAYYFIEDGQCHVKMRGLYKYDAVKPDRSTWTEEDFFKAVYCQEVITYERGLGFIWQKVD